MVQLRVCVYCESQKWFKKWGCLNIKFRHHIFKYAEVYRAVAAITQLGVEKGQTLFELVYIDDDDDDDIYTRFF